MHQRLQINGSIMVRRWALGAAVSHFGRALSLCESGATRRFIARDWHFADRDHLSPAGGKVVCLAAIGFFLGIYGVKGEIFRLSKWSKLECNKSRKMSLWSFTQ